MRAYGTTTWAVTLVLAPLAALAADHRHLAAESPAERAACGVTLVQPSGHADSPAHARGIGQAELAALTTELTAEAKAWASGAGLPSCKRADLTHLTYSHDTLEPLEDLLQSRRQDAEDLYVANRLLEPLAKAELDVIRAALPIVKALNQRMGRYRAFPAYGSGALAALRVPDYDPRSSAEAIMANIGAVMNARDRKLGRDWPIARNNEQVYMLEKQVIRLMILADDAGEDAALMRIVAGQEEHDSWSFADVLEAIGAEARRMTQTRAKGFYQDLLKIADHLARKGEGIKSYACKGQAVVTPNDNSRFRTVRADPVEVIVKTMNRLAPVAQMAAINLTGRR